MMDKILFISYKECFKLPPFLALIDCLSESYDLNVLSNENHNNLLMLQKQYANKNVKFIYEHPDYSAQSLPCKIKRRLKNTFRKDYDFISAVEEAYCEIKPDILWIIHEHTACLLPVFLSGKKYILSTYELNDIFPKTLNDLKPLAQKAKVLITPEYNRSCIFRAWFQLTTTPLVIPNKPYCHPRTPKMSAPQLTDIIDSKIILYQGVVQPSRNVEKLCEAISDMPDYQLVIMGGKTPYREKLQCTYPNVRFIDFINPPDHLLVTSNAYIAVVKYDYFSLNTLYCAPNKTWEYSGFGIPMLANDVPGLKGTVEAYHAGVCTNMDDIDSIKSAINEIYLHYEEYQKGAMTFYDSIDLDSLMHSIILAYYE